MANTKITTNVIADGAITSAKLDTNITISGNITGTLATAAQPNITSVGTLTGFTSTGIDDNATSTAITIDSSENVGIKEGSPSATLHTNSGTGNIGIHQESTDTGSYISFSDNSTTSISHVLLGAVANDLVFNAGDAERMRIDGSSGNVGITAAASLRFNGTGDNTHAVGYDSTVDGSFIRGQSGIRVLTGTGGGTERMRVTSTGVGIGTTSPDHLLEVETASSSVAPKLGFRNTQAGTQIGMPANTNALALYTGDNERMRINSSGNVGIGISSPTANLSLGKSIGYNADSALFSDISINDSAVNNNAVYRWRTGMTGNATGHSLTFSTLGRTESSYVERMRIDSSGNVGIGTNSFSSNPHIRELTVKNTDTNGVSRYTLTTTDNGLGASIALSSYLDENALAFGLQTSYDEDGVNPPTERMRIDSLGNVGIGQTSPNNNSNFTSLSMGGTSGKSGLTEYKYSNNVSKGYLYAQSNAVSLEAASTNLIRFATNAAFRGAIDSKGTLFFGNGDSSYAHNTYAHAAVFSKNSIPGGSVVMEDMDASSGIGNTVLNCFLRDQDPTHYANFIAFSDGGGAVGSITHNNDGGGVTYNTTSDYRLKENVDYDWNALTLVNQLKPAKFNFIRQPTKTLQGFLAHEVKDIVPSSVQGEKDHIEPTGTIIDSDGNVVYEDVYEHFCKTDEGQTWTQTGEEPVYQELDYSRLVPLLTKAIQEQQTIIDDLKSRIETLEG